jgi:hypothetical protein
MLDSCVGNGPEWYDYKIRLASIEGYKRLLSLFVTTLRVYDADYYDLLEYLRHIKVSETYRTSRHAEEKIMLLYERLSQDCTDNAITLEVKYVILFELSTRLKSPNI